MFSQHLAGHTYSFASLTEVMAKASPIRSGDQLAGCAANSAAERVAAAMVLADVELNEFIRRPLIEDAVTDLIHRTHDSDAFRPLAHMTVGAFREYLLEQAYRGANISSLAWGLTPEMAAAVSKLMSNGELIAVSAALSVVTKFRTTLGLPGRLSSRLQPNHPTDDPTGVAASVLDGLLFGCGDAVVGINPAGDSPEAVRDLLFLLDEVRRRYSIPMQSSVLTHISTTIDLMEAGAPVDLPFQSIAGTEGALRSFGVSLDMLAEAEQAANELRRGTVGTNALYFETGQGSCLSGGGRISVSMGRLTSKLWRLARTGWRARIGRYWLIRWWGSSGPNTYTTVSKLSGRGWRTISAGGSWAFKWGATCATPTMPKRIATIWTRSCTFWPQRTPVSSSLFRVPTTSCWAISPYPSMTSRRSAPP